MKLIKMMIASLVLAGCSNSYASWIEPPEPDYATVNEWKAYTGLIGGFSAFGDNASIGSVGGVEFGAEKEGWKVGGTYSRADSKVSDVDFTLHSITADLFKTCTMGVLKAKAGVSLGVGIPTLDGARTGQNRVLAAFGAGCEYSLLPNLSLGLNVRQRVFHTEVLTRHKEFGTETVFQDGVPIGTVETVELVTEPDSVNLNALETVVNLTFRF